MIHFCSSYNGISFSSEYNILFCTNLHALFCIVFWFIGHCTQLPCHSWYYLFGLALLTHWILTHNFIYASIVFIFYWSTFLFTHFTYTPHQHHINNHTIHTPKCYCITSYTHPQHTTTNPYPLHYAHRIAQTTARHQLNAPLIPKLRGESDTTQFPNYKEMTFKKRPTIYEEAFELF